MLPSPARMGWDVLRSTATTGSGRPTPPTAHYRTIAFPVFAATFPPMDNHGGHPPQPTFHVLRGQFLLLAYRTGGYCAVYILRSNRDGRAFASLGDNA